MQLCIVLLQSSDSIILKRRHFKTAILSSKWIEKCKHKIIGDNASNWLANNAMEHFKGGYSKKIKLIQTKIILT